MQKVAITFDTYYTYDQLTTYLQEIAKQYPTLAKLESIGKSWEGRDIWLLALTNTAMGDAESKPAIYVDGNIHAGEVTGSMVCLRAIDYLVSNFNVEEEVTHLLNTRSFYILPRVNPDGAEKYLTTPYTLRSSVRPYPHEGIENLPGLHPEDINGDGRILQMRVRDDSKGEWKPSQKDPRLMLPRRPGERRGPFYRIYAEGYIKDYQGEPFAYHRTPWGLDLNRNFPSNWNIDITTAGPYPTSEPEIKAIVDFILTHKNIGALNCFHTMGGFFYRNPYTYTDEEMDKDDLRATQAIAREGFYATGYADVKSNNRSTLTEWAYEHLGIIGYTTELWDRQVRAGLTREELFKAKTEEEIENAGLKLLDWNDKELAGKGFFNWTPYTHPQLGEVEIGGWDHKFAVQNPPLHLLEQECHKNALWVLRQAAALPECKISNVASQKLNEHLYKITVTCENHGYLPSYITNKGKAINAVKPDVVSIAGDFTLVSGKKSTELGFLEGYMNGQGNRLFGTVPHAKNIAQAVWIVETKAEPCQLTVNLKSQRGGCSCQTITIE